MLLGLCKGACRAAEKSVHMAFWQRNHRDKRRLRFGGLCQVSQGIKRGIISLCRSFLSMTLSMTAAQMFQSRSDRALSAGRTASLNESRRFREGRPGIKASAPDKGGVNTINLFGRALCAFPFTLKRVQPLSGSLTVTYEFREHAMECGEFAVKGIDVRPPGQRSGRMAERSRKTGLDLLRATFNLARGDLEQHALS